MKWLIGLMVDFVLGMMVLVIIGSLMVAYLLHPWENPELWFKIKMGAFVLLLIITIGVGFYRLRARKKAQQVHISKCQLDTNYRRNHICIFE